mgnify:CR=1 FL=1
MEEKKIICIVEDNKPIRKLFCTLLAKAGFSTIDFENGRSALEWIKNNTPVCVLLDILLPDINGTELLTLIRELPNGKKIPIISVTGLAQSDDKKSFLDLGFEMYISKPVNTSTFAEEVQKVIGQKE